MRGLGWEMEGRMDDLVRERERMKERSEWFWVWMWRGRKKKHERDKTKGGGWKVGRFQKREREEGHWPNQPASFFFFFFSFLFLFLLFALFDNTEAMAFLFLLLLLFPWKMKAQGSTTHLAFMFINRKETIAFLLLSTKFRTMPKIDGSSRSVAKKYKLFSQSQFLLFSSMRCNAVRCFGKIFFALWFSSLE